MPELSDRAAIDFIKAVEKKRLQIVNAFFKLKDKIPADELRRRILFELKDFGFTNLNFTDDINKLIGAYTETLKGMTKFADVSGETLQALIDIDKSIWVSNANIELSAIQKELFNASLTNQWNQKAIINNLQTGIHNNLSEGQINTLIDTSLSIYERNVTDAMMSEMPPETLYIYIGPLDGKTREICNKMINAGPLTKDEIISRFGSEVLSVGGGFNCRHKWDIYLGNQKVATARVDKSGELLEE